MFNTVKDALLASAESANRSDSSDEQSKGAYWCHDCSERIRDVDVAGDDPPECPECDDEMAFERSPDSAGCAC